MATLVNISFFLHQLRNYEVELHYVQCFFVSFRFFDEVRNTLSEQSTNFENFARLQV